MTAATLRAAASRLRELAEAATPGPWVEHGHLIEGAGTVAFDKHMLPNDAALIAALDPTFALAVADWLEHEAEVCVNDDAQNEPVRRSALAVAAAVGVTP